MSFRDELGLKVMETTVPATSVVVKANHPAYILPMLVCIILLLFYAGFSIADDYKMHQRMDNMEVEVAALLEGKTEIYGWLRKHDQYLNNAKISQEEKKVEKEVQKENGCNRRGCHSNNQRNCWRWNWPVLHWFRWRCGGCGCYW